VQILDGKKRCGPGGEPGCRGTGGFDDGARGA